MNRWGSGCCPWDPLWLATKWQKGEVHLPKAQQGSQQPLCPVQWPHSASLLKQPSAFRSSPSSHPSYPKHEMGRSRGLPPARPVALVRVCPLGSRRHPGGQPPTTHYPTLEVGGCGDSTALKPTGSETTQHQASASSWDSPLSTVLLTSSQG